MKILLETFFSLVFFGIFIACLPTIIGFVALCFILYFAYTVVKSLFSDGTEQTDNNYRSNSQTSKQDESTEWQSLQHKQESETAKNQKSYSGYSYPRYRRSNYDDYDGYYDDWHDNDMPPEEGDGWHGTGNPYV
jgi:hypothetical protein